jgi:hypothetical protein
MTAEIAILNKSAIVLAADSAITISAGSNQEKIYDSADKLFELSCTDPVAIMVNNNMHFMEVPLQVIIKDYRAKGLQFDKIEDAALSFLKHLESFGNESPDAVKRRSIINQLAPMVAWLQEKAWDEFMDLVSDSAKRKDGEDLDSARSRIVTERIKFLEWVWGRPTKADFLNRSEPVLGEIEISAVQQVVEGSFTIATAEQQKNLVELVVKNADRNWLFQPTTGVVIAGFGSKEMFPTLKEFQVVGMVGGALKFQTGNDVDIDRNGVIARVLPFAQRDMVERFLYGLDGEIERKIKAFCQRTIPKISDHILVQMDLEEEARWQLEKEAMGAEKIFLDGLQNEGFSAIREDSRSEIEDMVEFMPKSEMARMAEALVNLTSIKRRVSRGMETVGGPIDVAVVSKAEGFVWVKRKHYFPPELNARYFERINPK